MKMQPIQQTPTKKTEWDNSDSPSQSSLKNFEVLESTIDRYVKDFENLDPEKFRYHVSELFNNGIIPKYHDYEEVFADESKLYQISSNGSTGNQSSSKEKQSKRGTNFRDFYSLEKRYIIEKKAQQTDIELLQKYGVLPGRKYTVDVHLEISKQLALGNNPSEIAEYLRGEYEVMDQACVSKNTPKVTIKILEKALSDSFIHHPILREDYSILVDATKIKGAGISLLVIQAVKRITMERLKEINPSLAKKLEEENEDREDVLIKVPLTAKFVASVDGDTVISLLKEFRYKLLAYRAVLEAEFGIGDNTKLPKEPIAIVCDFASALLPMIGQVWPRGQIIEQGCHFHFLGIIEGHIIEDEYKRLREICAPLLSDLRYYAKKHRFRHKSSKFENVMSEVISHYMEKRTKGKQGENLINTLEKFFMLRRKIVNQIGDLEAGKIQPQTGQGRFVLAMKEILVKHNIRDTNKAIRSVKQGLQFFKQLKDCLSTEFHDEEEARDELLSLSKLWRRQSKILDVEELKDAADKIEKHCDRLIPAMGDSRIPRTTSVLEGTHGVIKKILRQWGGRSETPSTFEWVASTLTLLQGYDFDDEFILSNFGIDDLEQWGKLNLELTVTPGMWINSSYKVTDEMSYRREILDLSRPMKKVKTGKSFVSKYEEFCELMSED